MDRFKVGNIFNSFKELEEEIKAFEQESFVNLAKRHSRTIENVFFMYFVPLGVKSLWRKWVYHSRRRPPSNVLDDNIDINIIRKSFDADGWLAVTTV